MWSCLSQLGKCVSLCLARSRLCLSLLMHADVLMRVQLFHSLSAADLLVWPWGSMQTWLWSRTDSNIKHDCLSAADTLIMPTARSRSGLGKIHRICSCEMRFRLDPSYRRRETDTKEEERAINWLNVICENSIRQKNKGKEELISVKMRNMLFLTSSCWNSRPRQVTFSRLDVTSV